MTKNPGDDFRRSEVRERNQMYISVTKQRVKRDTETGEFTDVKEDGGPFKGVHEAEAHGHQQPDPGQASQTRHPSGVVTVDRRPAAPPANPTRSAGAVLARRTQAKELPAWCSSTPTMRGHLGDPHRQGSHERGSPQLANLVMSKDGPGGSRLGMGPAHRRPAAHTT